MKPRSTIWPGLLLATAAQAATLSLTPAKDNTLYENSSGALSNGSGRYLFAGKTNEPALRRALLAFDLSAIPANAQLTRVALTLTLSKTISGAQAHTLRRVLAAWGEGNSDAGDPGGKGAIAATGDATWLHTFASTAFWTSPGGDYADTPSASQSVSGAGNYTWESAQMLADVRGWVSDPASNFGWVLLGNEAGNGTAKRFHSRETSTASQRPKLTVEYTLPNSAPTAGALPSLHLALRGGSISIDPAAAPASFSDADGDLLTYRIANSDTAKVAATLMENILFVGPKAPGSATLTLSAEDGRGGKVSVSFRVDVNTPPTLGAIPDQTIDENSATALIPLALADAETAAAALSLSARSGNTLLLPSSGIALGGSGAKRTLQLTPAPDQSGSATLTLRVFDGSDSTSQSFTLTVNPVVEAPVGDFDGDLEVGFADFFLFADHFGQTPASPGWDARYDLDADLAIGFGDFFLFADHFGAKAAP
jgi:hypothetical protein